MKQLARLHHQLARARRAQLARRQDGQAIMEMAIVIPIVLLLIFGAIDAIQIAMTNYHIDQAAEVAVHEAALMGGPEPGSTTNGNLETAKGAIAEKARLVLDAGLGTDAKNATIIVTCVPANCPRYARVTVEIRYKGEAWAPIGPFSSFSASSKLTRLTEQDQQTSTSTTAPLSTTPGGPTAFSNPGLSVPGGNTGGSIPGSNGGIPGSNQGGQ